MVKPHESLEKWEDVLKNVEIPSSNFSETSTRLNENFFIMFGDNAFDGLSLVQCNLCSRNILRTTFHYHIYSRHPEMVDEDHQFYLQLFRDQHLNDLFIQNNTKDESETFSSRLKRIVPNPNDSEPNANYNELYSPVNESSTSLKSPSSRLNLKQQRRSKIMNHLVKQVKRISFKNSSNKPNYSLNSDKYNSLMEDSYKYIIKLKMKKKSDINLYKKRQNHYSSYWNLNGLEPHKKYINISITNENVKSDENIDQIFPQFTTESTVTGDNIAPKSKIPIINVTINGKTDKKENITVSDIPKNDNPIDIKPNTYQNGSRLLNSSKGRKHTSNIKKNSISDTINGKVTPTLHTLDPESETPVVNNIPMQNINSNLVQHHPQLFPSIQNSAFGNNQTAHSNMRRVVQMSRTNQHYPPTSNLIGNLNPAIGSNVVPTYLRMKNNVCYVLNPNNSAFAPPQLRGVHRNYVTSLQPQYANPTNTPVQILRLPASNNPYVFNNQPSIIQPQNQPQYILVNNPQHQRFVSPNTSIYLVNNVPPQTPPTYQRSQVPSNFHQGM